MTAACAFPAGWPRGTASLPMMRAAAPSRGPPRAVSRRPSTPSPASCRCCATRPVERFWGGVIDLTPDGLPALDAVPGARGLYVAAGFSGHGFGIGPATGHAMAALITGRASGVDLSPFALRRFAGGAVHWTAPATTPELHG